MDRLLKDYLTNIEENRLSIKGDDVKDFIKQILDFKKEEVEISKISQIDKDVVTNDFICFKDENYEYFLIGDIHQDLPSLIQILKALDFKNNFEKYRLIFLGDYVDRGKDILNTINTLILLKWLLPENVFLLKGNHELYIKDEKGFYHSPMMGANPDGYHFDLLSYLLGPAKEQNKAVLEANGIDEELMDLYAKFFDDLPVLALFNFENIKVCGVHGGLPRADLNNENYYDFKTFNQLLNEKTLDCVGLKQKNNMLWSDPYDGNESNFKTTSHVRFKFNKNQFIAFSKLFDVDLMIRAHEEQEKGYKTYFESRLISVFSSGGKNKDGEIVNTHSYYTDVSPNVIKLEKERVVSYNINFSGDEIFGEEESFSYADIKSSRTVHENEYKPNEIKELKTEDILNTPDAKGTAIVIDFYHKTTKKYFTPKEGEFTLNYARLQDMYCVYKHLNIKINVDKKQIYNYTPFEIYLLTQSNKKVAIAPGTFYNLIDKKFAIHTRNGMKLLVSI